MRIASVRTEKFRSFPDATTPINDYAGLVSPLHCAGQGVPRLGQPRRLQWA